MRGLLLLLVFILSSYSFYVIADKPKARDISHLIPKKEFMIYKDVADFIDKSPKVTITVSPSKDDVNEYGQQVVKTLTGSDCDRDGEMDDNTTCNAVFYKLWLKYSL
ncbi:hypothetical protein L3081_05450 [Colwellia sp. MSW7]|uniref:Uncharacterized protein n=1 Tax=Colwellia maritima TaxID=2912588 RepID=A0ABS9WY73_9GAMM|nr:hypothetical protein [Colwellia maritima]MCI2282937.1 hypothetical protein [Colwellia maritima]